MPSVISASRVAWSIHRLCVLGSLVSLSGCGTSAPGAGLSRLVGKTACRIAACRPFLSAILVCGLTACVQPPPPELAHYQFAFEEALEASETVGKAFEPIERDLRAPENRRVFDPDDAPYIAPDGRGGVSRLIGEGFAAVAAWNAVLARYADGQSLSLIRPQIEEFAASTTLLTALVGLPGVSAGVKPAVAGLLTLADAALAVADRQALAEVVRTRADPVDEFLSELRALTPDMFRVAVAYSDSRKIELVTANRADDARNIDDDLASFRQMLASWVLTIDRTREALGRLEAAVAAGGDTGPMLAGLVFWTGELEKHAESVKFAYRGISEAF